VPSVVDSNRGKTTEDTELTEGLIAKSRLQGARELRETYFSGRTFTVLETSASLTK
jgi:hypothetical protein